MDFPFGETVTIRRASFGGADVYDQPDVPTWTETDVSGVGVAPGPSEDMGIVYRDGVTIDFTLYLPAGTDVLKSDRVVVRGVEHTIEGAPAEWHHPMTGWEPGTVVAVSRVEG